MLYVLVFCFLAGVSVGIVSFDRSPWAVVALAVNVIALLVAIFKVGDDARKSRRR